MERRRFLGATLGSITLAALPGARALAQPASTCGARTQSDIEGPFYRPHAPASAQLTDSPTLHLSGTVTDVRCRPLADAVLDVWQADAEGEYDTTGFRFRGLVRTDAAGRWNLATIRPGHYRTGHSYRPAHLHVKLRANGRPSLTTQLYFPGDPYNDSDPWFRDSLLVRLVPVGCSRPPGGHAQFDFVV